MGGVSPLARRVASSRNIELFFLGEFVVPKRRVLSLWMGMIKVFPPGEELRLCGCAGARPEAEK